MKKVLTAVVLAALLFPASAGAWTKVWTGDFNTGDFSQWKPTIHQGPDGDCCAVVVKDDHPSAGRFTVDPGDTWNGTTGERAEVYQSNPTVTANEGDVQRWRWSTDFPAFYLSGMNDNFHIWTQFHQAGTECSPPIQFNFDTSQTPIHLRLTVAHVTGFSPCTYDDPDYFDLGPVAWDTWETWNFYVTWSSDPTVGSVEVLRAGNEVVPPTHVATMYPGMTNYIKQGLYRGTTVVNPKERLWIDNTDLLVP
jgi:hypothetical protein